MQATKAKASKAPATQGFRVILRGHNKAGQYKRAVRTVQATSIDAAQGYIAENGEKLAKGCKFNVEFVNVFAPLV